MREGLRPHLCDSSIEIVIKIKSKYYLFIPASWPLGKLCEKRLCEYSSYTKLFKMFFSREYDFQWDFFCIPGPTEKFGASGTSLSCFNSQDHYFKIFLN